MLNHLFFQQGQMSEVKLKLDVVVKENERYKKSIVHKESKLREHIITKNKAA